MTEKTETIQCPHHKKPIAVLLEEGRKVAYCTCVPGSQFHGVRVWLQLPADPKSAEVKKEN